ncbi:MAG: hypothetical protein AB7F88_09900 [Pyrinomonadaceae bacterium]
MSKVEASGASEPKPEAAVKQVLLYRFARGFLGQKRSRRSTALNKFNVASVR